MSERVRRVGGWWVGGHCYSLYCIVYVLLLYCYCNIDIDIYIYMHTVYIVCTIIDMICALCGDDWDMLLRFSRRG